MGAEAASPSGSAKGDGGGEGLGEEGGPGHQPDEHQAPEEGKGHGGVVAGDAEVEVAEELLVDEIEPGPAVDVVVGGKGDRPVALGKGKLARVALGGVGESDEDVPGGGDPKEGERGGEGMELAEALCGASESSCGKQVNKDNADGKDEANEAFGEDVEGAGRGEEDAGEEGGCLWRFHPRLRIETWGTLSL